MRSTPVSKAFVVKNARVLGHADGGLLTEGEAMGDHTTDRQKRIVQELTFDGRTAKRVRWTEWEFTIDAPHQIRVSNASYGIEKDAHTYTVTVADHERQDGLYVPLACDCPAYHFGDDELACKHMVAVAVCGGSVLLGAAMAYMGEKSDDRDYDGTELDTTSCRQRVVAADGGCDQAPHDDRDIEPERARERESEGYPASTRMTPKERADALGFDHIEECDGESQGLRCFRCYYIRTIATEE